MTNIIDEKEFVKFKKKKSEVHDLNKEESDLYDYDENSDLPVIEKKVKQKKIRT
ncbi:hypothetical protein HOK51_09955 [Candidatus Woesearchaeota archaeon]|jgi:hypothetical protein|nr:hypothetical protein [Candidatus Woesearchaeota archaeon]MBT6520147.1 hypothetical protein [Candidatus Woesearchaeota archaeon]MBT7366752.1 hypothetical protein [Candidatus Woesearchaeota archaeon]